MKLLLVDDHPLFRDGLSLLIQHRLTLPESATEGAWDVMEAQDLTQAQAVLRNHPDVALALLDLGLGEHSGLDTLLRWRSMAPDVPVVVLSADDRVQTVLSAIEAGASGFIPKTVQASTMQQALVRVLDGGVYLPALASLAAPPPSPVQAQEAAAELSEEFGTELSPSILGLSARQIDVLRLLIEGKANKEISHRLGLSDSTVKTHLAAIFRKLGVGSRTQAVIAVARLGVSLHPAPNPPNPPLN